MNTGEFVAVYGSLRKGLHNHRVVEGAPCLGTGTLQGFSMHDLGAFPALSKDNPEDVTDVKVELYQIDSDTRAQRLDCLEGYPRFYNRKRVTVDIGDQAIMAWVYFIEGENNSPVVESGDWKEHYA